MLVKLAPPLCPTKFKSVPKSCNFYATNCTSCEKGLQPLEESVIIEKYVEGGGKFGYPNTCTE